MTRRTAKTIRLFARHFLVQRAGRNPSRIVKEWWYLLPEGDRRAAFASMRAAVDETIGKKTLTQEAVLTAKRALEILRPVQGMPRIARHRLAEHDKRTAKAARRPSLPLPSLIEKT